MHVAEQVGGVEAMQQQCTRFVSLALCDEIHEPVIEGPLPSWMFGGATDTAQVASHLADQVERVERVVGARPAT